VNTDENMGFDVPPPAAERHMPAPKPKEKAQSKPAVAPAKKPTAPQPNSEAVVPKADEVLPSDLKSAFRLLRTASDEEGHSKPGKDRKEKQARLRRIQAHCHKLQQGLPVTFGGGPRDDREIIKRLLPRVRK
jgi:outer membrane biosynthesis protein TonB